MIIHSADLDLQSLALLRKSKLTAKFAALRTHFVCYISLMDFGDVNLFGNALMRMKNLVAISPGLPNYSNDQLTELSLYFEPGDESALDTKQIYQFVKDTYKFDSLYRPFVSLERLSDTRNLAILITEENVSARLLEDSFKILSAPSVLIEKYDQTW